LLAKYLGSKQGVSAPLQGDCGGHDAAGEIGIVRDEGK